MSKPSLTVVIPTRQRVDTLKHALRTVCLQPEQDFVILVSDNASADGTAEMVASIKDPRIKYVNPGRPMAMSAHYEFALGHVNTDYVLFMGDDDGLMPDALQRIDKLIQRHGRPPAISTFEASFIWDGPESTGYPNGVVPRRLSYLLSDRDERRDGKTMLSRFAHFENPCPWHDWHDLPCHYFGVVRMDIIEKARKGGTFFKSCSPDVYSAIALASVCGDFIYCEESFTLPGTSRHSTGMNISYSSDAASRILKAENVEYLGQILWHPEVPRIITSQAFIKWEAFRRAADAGLIPGDIEWDVDACIGAALAEAMAKNQVTATKEIEEIRAFAATIGKHIPETDAGEKNWTEKFSEVRHDWQTGLIAGQCPGSVQTIHDAVLFTARYLKRRRFQPYLRWVGRSPRVLIGRMLPAPVLAVVKAVKRWFFPK